VRGILLLLLSCAFGSATAQPIDFESADGPARSCPRYLSLDAIRLRNDAERVAYALCNFIDLVREAATRVRNFNEGGGRTDNAFVSDVRARLERVLQRLGVARAVLDGVKGSGPYFAVRPGEWTIDWNGDGMVDASERYLLWVPKRGVNAFRDRHRFATEEAYFREQFISPRIRIDRADVLWAVAYLRFIESALNLVLAYDYELEGTFTVRLRDRERVAKRSYGDLLGGIRASGQLRQALLKETDDEDEWIPSPRQARTSFPLVMDAQTFATWGELLGHMEKLFHGRTLLGGAVESRDFPVRDLSGGICAGGEGIDVRSLFTNPIREPFNSEELKSRCAAPTKGRPMSGLAAMIAESVRRNAGRTPDSFSGEWMILRHFYWVN